SASTSTSGTGAAITAGGPPGRMASTWCAFGAASADMLHIAEHVDIRTSPFDVATLNANFKRMVDELKAQLTAEKAPEDAQVFRCSLDIRHKGQINEVEVPMPSAELSDADVAAIPGRFHDLYQQIYGKGASFPKARLEAVTFRVRASAATAKPRLATAELTDAIPADAVKASRQIYWRDLKATAETRVYQGELLAPGNAIAGPAVIETADTTVVVHPGRNARVDGFGNIELTMDT
ncbi:MAG: hypothetical protein VW405_23225, partial [Rhodospirillaceae bacterium]